MENSSLDIMNDIDILRRLIILTKDRKDNGCIMIVLNKIFRKLQRTLGYNEFFILSSVVVRYLILQINGEIGKRIRKGEDLTASKEDIIEMYNAIKNPKYSDGF